MGLRPGSQGARTRAGGRGPELGGGELSCAPLLALPCRVGPHTRQWFRRPPANKVEGGGQ